MNEILLNIISSIVTVVLIPLITLLGTKLITIINQKVKNEKTNNLLETATMIVLNTVKAVFQTYVDTLKKSNSFDLESQKEALNQAKIMALSQMSAEVKAYIESTYGSLDNWLTTQIESTISTLKTE